MYDRVIHDLSYRVILKENYRLRKVQEGKKNSFRKSKFDLSNSVFELLGFNCIFTLNSVLAEILKICGQILSLNVFMV